MKGAKHHLNLIPSIKILKVLDNHAGAVIFFQDHEGINWHIKDYEVLDIYTVNSEKIETIMAEKFE
jgi:hypothetical protein